MNKTNYENIAEAFNKEVNWTQYLYAHSFNHGAAARKPYWDKLTGLESLAFRTANALADGNKNFDRDVFLAQAGMYMHDGAWSFIPNKQYIERATRG